MMQIAHLKPHAKRNLLLKQNQECQNKKDCGNKHGNQTIIHKKSPKERKLLQEVKPNYLAHQGVLWENSFVL
jgi:hypothetical protein